ncbi:hypothetical protein [Streptomyces antimycoticus]|uniref:hypothetical protein n=1 Tax=Streptomyces antimycoticus TaxID=68175 RepID=UPI0038632DB1|nr:hypothetical protein OG751_23065 [Streptomyces antimycoticus]
MTERTLTPGPLTALTDDIRDHGYAIVQTRIERTPARLRVPGCTDLAGCDQPATLLTLAVAEVTEEDGAAGFRFARVGGEILRVPVCDIHRVEATHDLYYVLTGRRRPDGIRAFDLPGQHMDWI